MSNRTISNGSATANGQKSAGSALTTTPFPASRKVHVQGTQAGVRVPMREISLTATKSMNGGASSVNEPITIYDTSGPYTDPDISINAQAGLAPYRRNWVMGRNDVVELLDISSQYGRARAADPKLDELRFQHIRKPLRAKPGMNVTQIHYARKGIVTPEMEFIAIRENQSREVAREQASADRPPPPPGRARRLTPANRPRSARKKPLYASSPPGVRDLTYANTANVLVDIPDDGGTRNIISVLRDQCAPSIRIAAGRTGQPPP